MIFAYFLISLNRRKHIDTNTRKAQWSLCIPVTSHLWFSTLLAPIVNSPPCCISGFAKIYFLKHLTVESLFSTLSAPIVKCLLFQSVLMLSGCVMFMKSHSLNLKTPASSTLVSLLLVFHTLCTHCQLVFLLHFRALQIKGNKIARKKTAQMAEPR